ncbi:MAG: hypothetical protein ACXVCY_18655 [Pseudobdellovibrionaceae bacterium]
MKTLISILIMLPTISWAHGENKPGPHGGQIRMPGGFHTEVVLDKDQSLEVYLLDLNFKNPMTENSKVDVSAVSTTKETVNFKCATLEDHFHCIGDKALPKNGELTVTAVRNKAVGNKAVYKLPFTFEHDDGGHHH